jgi:glycosyltransferase involved in cell wall biosynthesis
MDRPDELRKCLASVRSGLDQPDEIIVSDDGTDPETEAIALQFEAIYVDGPRRGLGPNRNSCIRAATGTHLAFIDDDVIVPPTFVAACRGAAGQDVVTGYEMRYVGSVSEKVTASNSSFLGYQERPIRPGDRYVAVVINATVFPMTLLNRVHFDENVRYGSEEIDMARQAVALGYQIRYSPDLWVEHYPSSVNRDAYRQVQLASLLYVTLRAYWRYDRSVPKSIAYLLYAPAQHYASALKHQQPLSEVTSSLRLAGTYWRADSQREGWGRRWSSRDGHRVAVS